MTEQIAPPAGSEIADPPTAAPDTAPASAGTQRPPRRALRAAARWTAAVLVCAGLGTGTAFGVSGMERGDVPGLSTRNDGRWEYPKLTLPALPAGSPRPFTDGNIAGIHHADLRELLLPAPRWAVPDKKLAGGWVSTEQYLSEYAEEERPALRSVLYDYSVRHIAARGWAMPDGTVSRVYLLRFRSVAFAESFYLELKPGQTSMAGAGTPLTEVPLTVRDASWDADTAVEDTDSYVFEEPEPFGPSQGRQAYIRAGDTLALVFQYKKGGSPVVPFHQTVILQNQLLG